ncbi:MAG TPA: hypothetical protein VI300_11205, partial [Solirubrobacter sp.]
DRPMRGVLVAATAVVLAFTGTPAVWASPPENDNFLAATALNSPGSQMPRDKVSYPVTDVTDATVQGDLLAPPSAGGPPEPSACGASPLGHTIWFRFFPDVDGGIQLQSVGFDTTLALVPFASVQSPLPQDYRCSNRRDDTIEDLTAKVHRGGSYAVQVGGAADAVGVLQVNFTFVPDRDDDGVSDAVDRCPDRPGTVNGCPPRIQASVPYKYDGTSAGARFRYLDVRGAPKGSRVDVHCSRGCPDTRLIVRSDITHVKSFRGRAMPSGARIEIRVTKSGWIGMYRAFSVAAGDVSYTEGCLRPGSAKPRRSCR